MGGEVSQERASLLPGVIGAAMMLGMVNWVPDAGVEPRWVLFALVAGVLALGGARVPWPVLCAAAFAAVSLLWAQAPLYGVVVPMMLLGFGAIAGQAGDPRWADRVMIGAVCGLLLQLPLVVGQKWLGWTAVPQTAVPGGLFVHADVLGTTAALVAVWVAGGQWRPRAKWPVVMGLVSLVALSFCRAAELGLVVAGLGLWKRNLWGLLLIPLAIAVAIGMRDPTVMIRMRFWMPGLEHLVAWGHGSGQWMVEVGAPQMTLHAHNDLLEMVYEQGLGAVFFGGFIVVALTKRNRAAAVVACYLAEASFGFPLEMPSTAFLLAVAAGSAWAGADGMGDLVGCWVGGLRAGIASAKFPRHDPSGRGVPIAS